MISGYLESRAAALSFDRSLSRRVRQEVEDHLRGAVAADPRGDGIDAEERAIANFGDPQLIAAQFAMVSLAKRTRGAGIAVILVIAGVFITMKARVAWYAAMQCAISDDIRAVSGIVGSIDRYAFWLSVIIGIGGWAYICGRRIPAEFPAGYRNSFVASVGSARSDGRAVVSVIGRLLTALGCLSRTVGAVSAPHLFDRNRSRCAGVPFSKFAASRSERHPQRPC